jgi:catechol 2,3-dioxygenase-like lactoylglutathione lyase family enzyme
MIKSAMTKLKRNSMGNVIFVLAILAMHPTRAAWAQVAPPNEEGVSMGHLHFHVKDVDAYHKFFVDFGGVPIKEHNAIKFPGVFILLTPSDPAGPTVGSSVNHVGFMVKDTPTALAKWNAAGLKTEVGKAPGQAFVYTPDNLLRIEIYEDKTMTVPIAFHHIHFYVPDAAPDGGSGVKEIQSWYAKFLGAKPGQRGNFQTAMIPGAELTFSKSDAPVGPTVGRVLDHIGFEIAGLQAFCEKEKAAGVKFETPSCAPVPGKLFNIYLTDPWGTRIELTSDLTGL